MTGMNALNGKTSSGIAYLRQRIQNALTTPVNSTTMHRERGSRLFALVDQPLNDATIIDTYAAVAECLQQPLAGVPDFSLSKVQAVRADESGVLVLDLQGEYLPDGASVLLEGIVI